MIKNKLSLRSTWTAADKPRRMLNELFKKKKRRMRMRAMVTVNNRIQDATLRGKMRRSIRTRTRMTSKMKMKKRWRLMMTSSHVTATLAWVITVN